MRALLLSVMAAILVGCSGSGRPSFATPSEAVKGYFRADVNVYQEAESAVGKILMIDSPWSDVPIAVLVEPTGRNRWQMWPGQSSGAMRNIGPVSYHMKHMGEVERRSKPPSDLRTYYPKVTVVYGLVNDPRITWVQVQLIDDDSAEVKRIPVVNGTWVAEWPWKIEYPPRPKVALRAGDEREELFAVRNVLTAPGRHHGSGES